MGDPQAPGLPKEAPGDLRDFVDCKGKTVSIASGKLAWLPMPDELKGFGKPDVSFKPGKAPGTVTITVDFEWAPEIEVTGTVTNGQLTITLVGKAKLLPEAIRKALTDWVAALNAWLKANGWQFGAPVVKDGTLTLTKAPIAGAQPGVAKPAAKPKPVPAPQPGATPKPGSTPKPAVTPKPATSPTPGATPTPGGKVQPPKPADAPKPTSPTSKPDVPISSPGPDGYWDTPIPPPPLPKGEVFKNPQPSYVPPPPKADQVGLGPTDGGVVSPAEVGDLEPADVTPVLAEGSLGLPAVDQRTEPAATQSQGGPSRAAVIVAGVAAAVGGTLLGLAFLGGAPGAATPTPPQAAVASPSPVREVTPSTVREGTPSPVGAATPTPTPSPTPTLLPTPSFVESMIDYLTALGVEEAEFTRVMADAIIDLPRDQSAPDGGAAAIQPGVTDIQQSAVATVEMSAPLEAGLTFSSVPEDFVPSPAAYQLWLLEMDEPLEQIPDASYAVGVAWLDETPLDGSIPDTWDGGPQDYRRTMNTLYAVRFGAPGSAPELVHLRFTRGDDSFHAEETDAFGYYSGNVLGIFVPEVESEGLSIYRTFALYEDVLEETIAVDTWPDIAEDSQVIPGELPAIELP